MFSTDLEIKKSNGEYILHFEETPIKCLFSDDIVSSAEESVIRFVRDDFDRCGSLKIEDGLVETNGVNCGYHLFSIQKYKIENAALRERLLNDFRLLPKYDFSLIQVANGGPMEIEEFARLTPVREALEKKLGKEVLYSLQKYAWAAYYLSSGFMDLEDGEYDGPGAHISDEAFKTTDASIEVHGMLQELSKEDAACVCMLLESLNYRSLFLPLAFVKGWITKNQYVSATMVLAGQVLDLSWAESSDEMHQNSFRFHSGLAEICETYRDIGKSNEILVDESIIHEFKASLRTPYPRYPEPEEHNNQTIYRHGSQTFTSKKQIQKALEKTVMKAVAGMLNSRGGKIVIGVHEKDNKKNVIGIDREPFNSHDLYERHLVGLLNNVFGKHIVSKYITTNMESCRGETICVIRIEERSVITELARVDGKAYVRTGPRTDELSEDEARIVLAEING